MVAASAERIDGQPLRAAGLRARLARGLAASVLVASILPVVLLGPSLLRAPLKLGRELHADVQRLVGREQAVGHGLTKSSAQAAQVTARASGSGRR
jgi:hypothetical protein